MYSVYLLELQNKEVLRQSEKFFPPQSASQDNPFLSSRPRTPRPTRDKSPLRSGERDPTLRDKRVQRSTAPRTPQKLRLQGGVCVRKGGVGRNTHPHAATERRASGDRAAEGKEQLKTVLLGGRGG